MKQDEKINLLLLGYLPPPVGGVTVLFKQLVNDLKEYNDLNLEIINLSTTNKSFINKVKVLLTSLYLFIKKIRKVDVISLHATSISAFILGPIIYFFAKLYNKKVIFRKFGGDFHKRYEKKSKLMKYLLKKTILKSDICLFETKKLVNYFKSLCKYKVKWYPNSRKKHRNINLSDKANNFIFISQIKEGKGVKKIFKASSKLPESINIDLYGPLGYDISEREMKKLDKKHLANYKGVLNPSEVLSTLTNYDILLLPTFLSEGYPGIILEAYSCGLPVITTKCGAISEIVDENSGIFIDPKSEKELINSILKIKDNKRFYKKLQNGALKKSDFFSANHWSKEFYKFCKTLN